MRRFLGKTGGYGPCAEQLIRSVSGHGTLISVPYSDTMESFRWKGNSCNIHYRADRLLWTETRGDLVQNMWTAERSYLWIPVENRLMLLMDISG